MSVAASIVEKAVEWAYRHLGALQICWLCLVTTIAAGWFFSTKYATAAEVAGMRGELVELKGDSIAKRIFDYRIRQCDTPVQQRQEKRWLVEQIRVDVEKYMVTTGKPFQLPACSDL